MRNPLSVLKVRRTHLLCKLEALTGLEKRGVLRPKLRARYASKLAHVDKKIFELKQGRLPL